MLSSLPCFYAFCWSAIPTSCFFLFISLFLAADACSSRSLPSITEQQVSPHRLPMLELKFATITEQQVSPHRLPMKYWLENHWPDQAFFKHSQHTNSISNSAILRNNYISLLKVQWFKVHRYHPTWSTIHNDCIQQTGKEMQHMQTQMKTLEICRCTAATCGCYVGEGTQMIREVWAEKLRHGHLRHIGIWICTITLEPKDLGFH